MPKNVKKNSQNIQQHCVFYRYTYVLKGQTGS